MANDQDNTLITKFNSTSRTSGKTDKVIVNWKIEEIQLGSPQGSYGKIRDGYYRAGPIIGAYWFLGVDSDPTNGYYSLYSCTENKDGTLLHIFQFETRNCQITENQQTKLQEILTKNNLNDLIKLEDGQTSACEVGGQCCSKLTEPCQKASDCCKNLEVVRSCLANKCVTV